MMNTTHVTITVPRGMRGDKQCPAERIGTPESGRLRRPVGSSTLAWAVVASVLAASTVAFGQGEYTSYIFGMDDNSDLWRMEVTGTSGTSTLVGSTPLTKNTANGLAYDSVRDQLFAVDRSSPGVFRFWWCEPGATSFTSLGTISGPSGMGQPVSAAYYNNAYWFLGQGSTGNLLGRLSLTYSGSDTPLSFSGTTFTITGMSGTASGGGDMVITGSGMLYAYSAPGVGNFFKVDVTTAASGTVGGYSLIKTTTGTGLQLALGWDGTPLYGTDKTTGNWYTVDTSNGNLTQIPGFQTLTTGSTGFNDLAGAAVGNPVVPEPSTCALALAGLACSGFAMWRRRKRD